MCGVEPEEAGSGFGNSRDKGSSRRRCWPVEWGVVSRQNLHPEPPRSDPLQWIAHNYRASTIHFYFFPFQLTLLALALGRNQPEKCPFPASLGRRRGWLVYCSETLLEATLPLPPTSPRVYCSLDVHPSPDGVAASIIGVICLLESHCRNGRGGDQRCRAVALNFLESRLLLSWPGRLDRRPGHPESSV